MSTYTSTFAAVTSSVVVPPAPGSCRWMFTLAQQLASSSSHFVTVSFSLVVVRVCVCVLEMSVEWFGAT